VPRVGIETRPYSLSLSSFAPFPSPFLSLRPGSSDRTSSLYPQRPPFHASSFFPLCRHEMPTSRSDPLANQNVKDRFYGQDDPVAQKMLGRAASKEKEDQAPLIPPTDPEIKTLMVGGMEGGAVTETEMREAFYGFGEVAGVRMVPAKHLAFVEYTTREAAEAAAKALHNNLTLQGLRLRVSWALRPAGSGPSNPGTGTGSFASAGGAGPLGAPPDFASQPVSTMAGQSLPLPPPQPLNFPPGPSPSSWVPGSNTLPPPGGYPPPGPHPGQGSVRGPPSLPPPQQVGIWGRRRGKECLGRAGLGRRM
jgi:pre-mRNA-splicing factor RBM22/SLT11